MKKEFLGEFEELVLTIVMFLGREAYGSSIVSAIKEHAGRVVVLSAVHVTLYRLEDKGLLKSKFGAATSERGGRSKRLYTLTNTGLTTLRNIKNTRMYLWTLIPQL